MPGQPLNAQEHRASLPFIVVLWVVTSGYLAWGLVLHSFDIEQVSAQPAPSIWPAESRLVRSPGRYTAVMMLDPRCGCSRASLAELLKLDSQLEGDWQCVVVIAPNPVSSDSVMLDRVYCALQGIPGIEVVLDTDSHEARSFQASLSGELMLYAPEGQLKFRGGITPSRGHEGDSVGALAIRDWVDHGNAIRSECPIYGCRISMAHRQVGKLNSDRGISLW